MAQDLERKLPALLSREECAALLQIPNPHTKTGIRNLSIMMLMLTAGLKVSEIVGKEKVDEAGRIIGGLRLEDIDLAAGMLTVRKKSGRMRTVTLEGATEDYLKHWLEKRPETDTNLVFVTHKGGKINNRYVREFLEKYGNKAGIETKVHPSMLRHTFAGDLYERSHNIRLVQQMLGHDDISTTAIYAELIDLQGGKKMRTHKHSGQQDVKVLHCTHCGRVLFESSKWIHGTHFEPICENCRNRERLNIHMSGHI
jgi:integrase/recombinase XerC